MTPSFFRYDDFNHTKKGGCFLESTVGYRSFREGVQACIPTMMGYLGIGFAAGVVEKGVGLSLVQIATLSLLVYAGSGQFIICGLIALQAPIPSIIITVFLVNFRHLLMSLSVVPYFRGRGLLTTIGVGTLLTDESYGVLTTALQAGEKVSTAWCHGINVAAYIVWLVANLLGGLLGQFIPNPERFGLDFALTAMFLGLWLFQVQLPLKKRPRQSFRILLAVVVTLLLCMRLFSGEVAVIAATLVGCLVGVLTEGGKS